MHDLTRNHAARLFGAGVITCALCGCGTGRTENDVIPAQDKARATLETALNAWKNGQKCGKVQGDSVPIEVLDETWKSGAKLASYQILEPLDKPGGPRWFSVKLTLQEPSETQQVNYAVLGLDPLWVYREVDYNKACGMGP